MAFYIDFVLEGLPYPYQLRYLANHYHANDLKITPPYIFKTCFLQKEKARTRRANKNFQKCKVGLVDPKGY
jgi:hypothetical protein